MNSVLRLEIQRLFDNCQYELSKVTIKQIVDYYDNGELTLEMIGDVAKGTLWIAEDEGNYLARDEIRSNHGKIMCSFIAHSDLGCKYGPRHKF